MPLCARPTGGGGAGCPARRGQVPPRRRDPVCGRQSCFSSAALRASKCGRPLGVMPYRLGLHPCCGRPSRRCPRGTRLALRPSTLRPQFLFTIGATGLRSVRGTPRGRGPIAGPLTFAQGAAPCQRGPPCACAVRAAGDARWPAAGALAFLGPGPVAGGVQPGHTLSLPAGRAVPTLTLSGVCRALGPGTAPLCSGSVPDTDGPGLALLELPIGPRRHGVELQLSTCAVRGRVLCGGPSPYPLRSAGVRPESGLLCCG